MHHDLFIYSTAWLLDNFQSWTITNNATVRNLIQYLYFGEHIMNFLIIYVGVEIFIKSVHMHMLDFGKQLPKEVVVSIYSLISKEDYPTLPSIRGFYLLHIPTIVGILSLYYFSHCDWLVDYCDSNLSFHDNWKVCVHMYSCVDYLFA